MVPGDVRGCSRTVRDLQWQPKNGQQAVGKSEGSLAAAAKNAPDVITDVNTSVKGQVVSDTETVSRLDLVPIDGVVGPNGA